MNIFSYLNTRGKYACRPTVLPVSALSAASLLDTHRGRSSVNHLFIPSLFTPPSHTNIPTFFACRVSAVHVRYLVWLWLSEFSSVVLSCFTHSRSTGFTDVSPTKPENSVNPLFKATICPLMSWVRKLVNTCAQPLRYSAVVAVTR